MPSFVTPLTKALDIEVPVIGAPMAGASGAELAAAVARAGGFGFMSAGRMNAAQLTEEYSRATELVAGCDAQHSALGIALLNFATSDEILQAAVACRPRAICLAFGDYARLVGPIKEAGINLMCQVRSLEELEQVLELGADVILAQGYEAGGHGSNAATTFCMVPEAADVLTSACARLGVDRVPLVAAGGIADGRQMAAALVLGADGVAIGTRLIATPESSYREEQKQALIAAASDASANPGTLKTTLYDELDGRPWPKGVDVRCLRNEFTERHHLQTPLQPDAKPAIREELADHTTKGSYDAAYGGTWAGGSVGLVRNMEPAEAVVRGVVAQAMEVLERSKKLIVD